MITKELILNLTIGELQEKFPFVESFWENHEISVQKKEDLTPIQLFQELDDDFLEEKALEQDLFLTQLFEFVEQMAAFLEDETDDTVESLTILAGKDKTNNPEKFGSLELKKNEVITIVGPTGSGKSRLLADIEWVAQRDTPTERGILINGEQPAEKWRSSITDKLVAQLSQNMNFVIDLSVEEFVEMHAESRMVANQEEVIKRIIEEANKLSGEQFAPDTPVTSLSGGQSRALMIADTAILSKSPVILIDEIENAGIDRKRALDLLLSEDKIVLISTHDPILALLGDRRIVIKNGGIDKIIETSDEERALRTEIEELDKRMLDLRNKLRYGEQLHL